MLYFTANPNGEAEVVKVTLEPSPIIRRLIFTKDFSEVIIKGRTARGNILTKHPISRISLKSHGHSTLGGRKVWFDPDVNRLNYDEHGRYLGEFNDTDLILVVLPSGEYYFTNFDVNNHYEDKMLRMEKFQPEKIWTAVVRDADMQNYVYVKRFLMESSKRRLNFLGENKKNELLVLTDQAYPLVRVVMGGADAFRAPLEIDVEEFAMVKGYKAHGKRLTNWNVASVEELEPRRYPEPEETEENGKDDGEDESEGDAGDPENLDPDAGKSERQIRDELTGQLNLFPDDM